MKFIVFGSSRDPHVQRVLDHVASLGGEGMLVPPWPGDSPTFPGLSWSPGAESVPSRSVFWFRNKHRVGSITSDEKRDEWLSVTSTNAFLSGIVDPGASRVINSGAHPAGSDLKIAQLRLARTVGLETPKTLVSNDKTAILHFLSQHPENIVKPLYSSGVPEIAGQPGSGLLIPTRPITVADVSGVDEAAFQAAPNIYQEAIPKAYELRIIAAGPQSIAYRIDSQSFALTRTDWRLGEGLIQCVRIETPPDLHGRLQAYMEIAGLDMTIFDIAVTPEGRSVFFESNPSGQWAAMEDRVEQEVSQMVAGMVRRLQAD